MTEKYGVNVFPGPTKGSPPLSVDTEIIALIGLFPIDKATDPTKGHPLEWYECNSWLDFKAAYGYEEFWGVDTLLRSAGFQTPKSAKRLIEGFALRPVLIYNIFDESNHTTPVVDESVTFSVGAGVVQPIANDFALIDTFVVTDDPMTVTYILDTDYSLERNGVTGKVEITNLGAGIGPTDSVLVDYEHADPSAVTTSEVTAGIDQVQNIITALGFAKLPGWVHCPKYSQVAISGTDPAAIRAQIKVNCLKLNEVFTTRGLYDVDETAYNVTVAAGSPDLTKIYDDKDVTSEHIRTLFAEGSAPGATEQLLSDWFLGLQTAEVAAHQFPCVSPSNRLLSDYTPNNKMSFPTQSNAVRDKGIICVCLDPADRGWVLWGTWTSYFNGTQTDLRLDSTNQNDLQNYLVKAITRDVWVQNTDRNFNKTTAADFVDKWNGLGKQQVSKGKLLGWDLVFDPAENPDLSQYVKFNLSLLGPEPMKRTDVEMQIDLNYFSTLFG